VSIWEECNGQGSIQRISGVLSRLVESQEQVATTTFVDTLEEQAILEELLDSSKPPQPSHTVGLHYLLATPFRYPPLKWGSRFGQKHEPSLFYGGTDIATTMAESAFYRFVYLDSMASDSMPSKPLSGQHTLFEVGYKSDLGVKLQYAPFEKQQDALRNPTEYQHAQTLGADMRNDGVVCFEYSSARHANGINVALFNGRCFTESNPKNLQQFISAVTIDQVEFKNIDSGHIYKYDSSQFRVNGVLPYPA